jgi:hypothetical protein
MNVPIADLIKLAMKLIRYAKGGYTKAELHDLLADLLATAAAVAEAHQDAR